MRVEAAEVGPEDFVLEIGPGTGALTEALALRVKKLLAVEIDHRLVERLQKHFIKSKNVSILEGNILDIHLEELLETSGLAERRYKIIANIPYYITAPIIRTLLALKYQPRSLTLMVQKEVADRLAAKPGDMSLLSLMAQYYARVEKKFVVSKTAFEPVPKIESAVIQLTPSRPYNPENDRKLFRLARAGFAARRKTLANNLASSLGLSRDKIERHLENLGLSPKARAQELSLEDWEKLRTLEPGA